jgi:hypothetical protein
MNMYHIVSLLVLAKVLDWNDFQYQVSKMRGLDCPSNPIKLVFVGIGIVLPSQSNTQMLWAMYLLGIESKQLQAPITGIRIGLLYAISVLQ